MIKLEVGKFYITRGGNKCHIIHKTLDGNDMPFVGMVGTDFYWYAENGASAVEYVINKDGSMSRDDYEEDIDIIGKWQEPEQAEPSLQQQINELKERVEKLEAKPFARGHENGLLRHLSTTIELEKQRRVITILSKDHSRKSYLEGYIKACEDTVALIKDRCEIEEV